MWEAFSLKVLTFSRRTRSTVQNRWECKLSLLNALSQASLLGLSAVRVELWVYHRARKSQPNHKALRASPKKRNDALARGSLTDRNVQAPEIFQQSVDFHVSIFSFRL